MFQIKRETEEGQEYGNGCSQQVRFVSFPFNLTHSYQQYHKGQLDILISIVAWSSQCFQLLASPRENCPVSAVTFPGIIVMISIWDDQWKVEFLLALLHLLDVQVQPTTLCTTSASQEKILQSLPGTPVLLRPAQGVGIAPGTLYCTWYCPWYCCDQHGGRLRGSVGEAETKNFGRKPVGVSQTSPPQDHSWEKAEKIQQIGGNKVQNNLLNSIEM